MEKFKVLLVGAGNRGRAYTNIMKEIPDKFEVVGVVEPVEARRNRTKEKFGIADDMCFEKWEDAFAKEKFADVALICTMDREHFGPAMAAIEKGYNLLLEKPVSPIPEECIKIRRAAKEKGVKVLVCHVLRYAPFFSKLKSLIDNGTIGRVMSIEHDECVGNVHQSHSFVRGNWGNSKKSSPMLLQKSCHDMDILQWLVGKKPKRVQSFGSTTYFTRENAPEGAPEYCIEGCPHSETCFYDATKIYFDEYTKSWYAAIITKKAGATDEDIAEALRTTQYGKCVFKCDNDVVDHQVVNLEFEDGTLANFNMCAFNKGGRNIRVMGTKGELYGSAGDRFIKFYNFATKEVEEIDTESTNEESILGGHGGGDGGIVTSLYEYLSDSISEDGLSEIGISIDNHMIVFAAEESRRTGTVVDVEEFINKF